MTIRKQNDPNLEIKAYTFQGFESNQKPSQSFEFRDFSKDPSVIKQAKEKISEKVIRAEREHASKNQFEIMDEVKKLRGITAQEKNDFENKVGAEVQNRLQQIVEDATQEGYQHGLEQGRDQAYQEAREVIEEKIAIFEQMITELNQAKVDVMEKNRFDMYKMIKSLTKWVALKEVDDQGYLPKLLEKLILEVNIKSNLLIKVSAKNIDVMPGVIEAVEQRIGKLTNVRLEINHDSQGQGIVVESENGIIDGTIESQLKSIDTVFETVGLFGDGA
jgi:flagellar assembly protein FliH